MSETSKRDTTAEGQPIALTIAEMMEKYPKDIVEKAMFQRNYKEYGLALSIWHLELIIGRGRDKTIRMFEDQIRSGINVETCKVGLEELLESTPSMPP